MADTVYKNLLLRFQKLFNLPTYIPRDNKKIVDNGQIIFTINQSDPLRRPYGQQYKTRKEIRSLFGYRWNTRSANRGERFFNKQNTIELDIEKQMKDAWADRKELLIAGRWI